MDKMGRTGVFTDVNGVNVEPRFAEYKGPLIAVTISDDDEYATAASVEALTSLYLGAKIRREVITPEDFNLENIGHFGFFHRRAPQTLWAQVEEWLRQLNLEADLAKFQSV